MQIILKAFAIAFVCLQATAQAAELLGWKDCVGSLEPGKSADLIAVDGGPLKGISELERIRFVMKGVAVVRNRTI